MKLIHLPVFSISNFGASVLKPTKMPGYERLSPFYEFEFYTEDCPGGLCNEGVFYQARQGGCTLSKPGQKQQMIRPYKCYFLNIVTQDPELCDMLDHLPSHFLLWNMEEVVGQLQKMIAAEAQDTLVSRMALQSCACRILALLSQYRQTSQTTQSSTLLHQKTLLRVDRYIREHLSEELSLATLAKLANLDPTYFHKLYTAAFGKTPAQRILASRIAAAKTGLIEGTLPLGELAAQCGFTSQTYFCYKFKQVTGKTPMQYRNDMLSQTKHGV